MARGWMGARSEFDAGDEDYDLPDVVMFCCLRCGGEVWQPLGAKRVLSVRRSISRESTSRLALL